ncbi:MAG: Smr/MutS family protein [Candidatus Riflebacteria bacterium]|nr:Smr/MutS family protein [Candidatus Riflebacteria bacterium]
MSDQIDLHGLTKIEAIEAFIKYYNSRVKKGNLTPFEVIHGYGSSGVGGVLRGRILGFLSSFPDELEYDSGKDPFKYNPGSTRVIPKKPLPEAIDLLCEDIIDFCESPKTLSKIVGKFHRYEEPKILASIKLLEKQKRLKFFNKGVHKVYQSTDV